MLLTTHAGTDPKVVTTMTYEGRLVNQDGIWKIQRWVVRRDTDQHYDKSNLPEGVRTWPEVVE